MAVVGGLVMGGWVFPATGADESQERISSYPRTAVPVRTRTATRTGRQCLGMGLKSYGWVGFPRDTRGGIYSYGWVGFPSDTRSWD